MLIFKDGLLAAWEGQETIHFFMLTQISLLECLPWFVCKCMSDTSQIHFLADNLIPEITLRLTLTGLCFIPPSRAVKKVEKTVSTML